MTNRRLALTGIATALLIACFAALVWYGSGGVRGSDQFWYVADAEALAGDAPNLSSSVFPVSVIPEMDDIPRPFVHNGPPLYAAAPLAATMGAYVGWIALIATITVSTAWGVFRLIRGRAGKAAALFALAYLLLPGTVWLATQPLIEPVLAALALGAVAAYAATTRRRIWTWYLLAGLAVLIFWSRPLYLPLLIFTPVAYAIREREAPRRIWHTVGLSAIGIAGVFAAGVLFPTNVECSASQFLSAGMAGAPGGNMVCFFDTVGASFPSLSDLVEKGIGGLQSHFIPTSVSGLVQWTPLNIALILFAIRLVRRSWDRTAEFTLMLVILHFLAIMGFQAQARYGAIVVPALIVSVVPWLIDEVALMKQGWRKGETAALRTPSPVSHRYVARSAVAAMFILILGADVGLVAYGRADSAAAGADIDSVTAAVSPLVPQGDRIAVVWEGADLPLLIGYAVRPRLVLFVLPEQDDLYYEQLVGDFGARWLLGPTHSKLIAQFGGGQLVPASTVEVLDGWVILPAPDR